MSLIESHSQDPTIEQWLHILSVDPEYKAAVQLFIGWILVVVYV